MSDIVYGCDISERFWSKVDKRGPDECWNWIGGINSTGRGIFWIYGGSIHAHRMSWTLAHGAIPDGKWVLHHCDNGKCVNPKHLFLGTVLDNVRDMISKGRFRVLVGEEDPKSKLTEAKVKEIHRLYATGNFTQPMLGEIFGVSRSTIEAVLNRYNWKHVVLEGADDGG